MYDFPARIQPVADHHDEPDWRPLERLLEPPLIGWFGWMGANELGDGTTVHAYRHRATRRYSHLGDDGRAFVYLGWVPSEEPSGFHETTLVSSLMASLGEWECLMPWPDDMPAMRRAISAAIGRALALDQADRPSG